MDRILNDFVEHTEVPRSRGPLGGDLSGRRGKSCDTEKKQGQTGRNPLRICLGFPDVVTLHNQRLFLKKLKYRGCRFCHRRDIWFRQRTNIKTLDELNAVVLKQIRDFFVNYQRVRDIGFRIIGQQGPERAVELLRRAALQKHAAQIGSFGTRLSLKIPGNVDNGNPAISLGIKHQFERVGALVV
jgi:hypothetical protein